MCNRGIPDKKLLTSGKQQNIMVLWKTNPIPKSKPKWSQKGKALILDGAKTSRPPQAQVVLKGARTKRPYSLKLL
jgi:hypothetical protein